MGLDGVELMLEIEDKFQISLGDDEVGSVGTVGELHALILTKLDRTSPRACATSMAFYDARRALMTGVGIARNQIRPASRLDSLFAPPSLMRRKQWRQVQESTMLNFPDLERLAVWTYFSLAIGAILGSVVAHRFDARWFIIALAMIPGAIAAAFACAFVPIGRWHFPQGIATVGDLARVVLGVNIESFRRLSARWTEDDVWNALKAIIVEQSGMPPEKVRPEAAIVGDLGID